MNGSNFPPVSIGGAGSAFAPVPPSTPAAQFVAQALLTPAPAPAPTRPVAPPNHSAPNRVLEPKNLTAFTDIADGNYTHQYFAARVAELPGLINIGSVTPPTFQIRPNYDGEAPQGVIRSNTTMRIVGQNT